MDDAAAAAGVPDEGDVYASRDALDADDAAVAVDAAAG